MSPAVGHPASLALLVSPAKMTRAHIATDLACWSIAMVEARLDLMVHSCMAKPLSAVRRGEAAAGLHGGTQRTPTAHGRTAQGLLSIIGSADAGHIVYESMKLKEAAKVVRDRYVETLEYCEMPREHWRRIQTNNAIERLNREIRRRTRVVGTFPDGKSALMLVAARLKYVADSEWGSRRYLDVSLLKEQSC